MTGGQAGPSLVPESSLRAFRGTQTWDGCWRDSDRSWVMDELTMFERRLAAALDSHSGPRRPVQGPAVTAAARTAATHRPWVGARPGLNQRATASCTTVGRSEAHGQHDGQAPTH